MRAYRLVPLITTLSMVAPALAQQPAVPKSHFDISEFRVEGNTVLAQTTIEAAVYPFLGPDRTIDDVEHARAALDAAYSSAGYATVSTELPQQRVTDGVVVLKVAQRPVGRLRVTGSKYYALGVIRDAAPSLAEGTVPNMKQVQHDIVALNQLPDRTVIPALRAGAAPDTVDVDLQVEDHLPLHATVELNDRQSPETTKLRLSASLRYDNLWQRGDSASVSFQVAPENTSDALVYAGSYLFHVPASDLSILASYLHSDSNVTSVGSTNVVGKGDDVGLRLLVPLGYGDGFVHTLGAGIDYKHFEENVLLGADTSKTPITYYPLTVTYQGSWNAGGSQADFDANAVFGLRGLGSNADDFDNKRFDARPNFAYFKAEISDLYSFPDDIQLYGRAQVQLSPVALISNEQFSLGGLDTVRGYLESEALGDSGGAIQSELRSPSIARLLGGAVQDLRLHAFFDAGSALIRDPLPEQTLSYAFYSAGVGARVQLLDYVYGVVEDAIALHSGPNTHSGTNRVLFRVYGSF